MINPFSLPRALLTDLRALSLAIKRLPEIERLLVHRLAAMHESMEEIPPRMDAILNETYQREIRAIDSLPERFDEMHREIAEIREIVDNLRGPSERLARLDDKLPGDG